MSDTTVLVVVLVLVYLLSGAIKGLSGFGMPMVSIPVSTLLLGATVPQAMSWALMPVFATNVVQLAQHWSRRGVVRRIWPLVLGMAVALAASVQLLAWLSAPVLSMLVGAMMLVSVASQLAKPMQFSPSWQPWALGISGLISGALGGVTSFFGFPALQALIASGLHKDDFVFSVSLTFLVGGVILAIGLGGQGLVTGTDALLSLLVLLPALLGLNLGHRARNRLSVTAFRRLIFGLLLLTGLSMVANGWLRL
ncbi:sulfite exporter TauE/SafE family protein [Saccharospirillum mangrovi]|uniref:sulfite exporter TauE/SafE family protein n=1 Tax=Saccharospirillum mangrovi TaxID=2161747 RepID=UPI000D3AA05A|nr:sulfite exporter TauE/SafE family protein [Saccharospirillum mangrovi]